MTSVLFSIPKIQDGRHIDILSMLSNLLKKNTKTRGNYLVVEPKMYFFSKLGESSTLIRFDQYMRIDLDHQYFIILNLST